MADPYNVYGGTAGQQLVPGAEPDAPLPRHPQPRLAGDRLRGRDVRRDGSVGRGHGLRDVAERGDHAGGPGDGGPQVAPARSRATPPTSTASTGSPRFWSRRTTRTASTWAATASSSPTTGARAGAPPTTSPGDSTRTASRSWASSPTRPRCRSTTAHRAMARSRPFPNRRSPRGSCGPVRGRRDRAGQPRWRGDVDRCYGEDRGRVGRAALPLLRELGGGVAPRGRARVREPRRALGRRLRKLRIRNGGPGGDVAVDRRPDGRRDRERDPRAPGPAAYPDCRRRGRRLHVHQPRGRDGAAWAPACPPSPSTTSRSTRATTTWSREPTDAASGSWTTSA